MRRVLFIAYLYPPIANSGTRRSIEFVNHLPDTGWTPTVLTVADPPPAVCDPTLLDDIRPGICVERAPLVTDLWANHLSRWVPASCQQRVRDGLQWRLKRLFTFPDGVAAWRQPAVKRALALHQEHPFDLVYATGWPWTSFCIALDLSRLTGLPYVLDYRDPWRSSGTVEWEADGRLQKWFGPRVERSAAQRASAVVTTTGTLAEVIGQSVGRDDLQCITNGFEPTDFNDLPRSPDDGFVRIAYTGVWRPGYGPDLLYRALKRAKDQGLPGLERLRVTVAGFRPGPASEYGIEDIVTELGPVPHAQALVLMSQADVLFLPVSQGFYAMASLPGKLFEYIGSRRPILAAALAHSEVARVLFDVGGSLRLEPDDELGVLDVLRRLCTTGDISIPMPLRPARLMRYTRASTARQLGSVFDGVMETRHDRRP